VTAHYSGPDMLLGMSKMELLTRLEKG
jgi:hypothetical protein